MHIPAQYNPLMPYLILKRTEQFKQFMVATFDATDQLIIPAADGSIMHGELRIGDAVIMYSEAGEQFPVMNAGMFIYVEDADSTYKKALAAGAVVVPGQEPSDKDYGRTCGLTDPFGNVWWLVSEIRK
jgi:PhnB protein